LLFLYMLGQNCFFFLCSMYFFCFYFQQKGGGGFDARFLLKFSDISCIFICFNNSLCFDRIYIHMVKILSLICAEFSNCIYLIDSYFSHVMKMCTIQGSLKVFFSPLIFFASKKSFESSVFFFATYFFC
jgi:hypothetical protein